MKVLHTVAWAFFASCIVAIPLAVVRGRLDVAAACIGIVAVECLILVLNRWRCPLTDVAARYTEDRRPNFDIYLPEWLARHNKTLFGALYAGGVVWTLATWLGRRGWGLLLLLAVAACAPPPRQPPASVVAEAKRELEARGRADQAVREGFGTGGTVDTAQLVAMVRADSANTAWLKAHVARWGWPTVAQVGREAVQAAFLIVQHAVHDTAFMRAMLPSIEAARERDELDGGDVAMLIDRLEVKAGRPQVYGTQLSLRNGRWVLDPIGDSAGVDARRRRMGLPPLAEYLRVVDSVFRTR